MTKLEIMREYIAILKKLGAHQKVIDIAEDVLRKHETEKQKS